MTKNRYNGAFFWKHQFLNLERKFPNWKTLWYFLTCCKWRRLEFKSEISFCCKCSISSWTGWIKALSYKFWRARQENFRKLHFVHFPTKKLFEITGHFDSWPCSLAQRNVNFWADPPLLGRPHIWLMRTVQFWIASESPVFLSTVIFIQNTLYKILENK